MVDRLDYELRAIEADNRAETAQRISIAHSWRDIACGYRMLADFIAHAQAATLALDRASANRVFLAMDDGREQQEAPCARDALSVSGMRDGRL